MPPATRAALPTATTPNTTGLALRLGRQVTAGTVNRVEPLCPRPAVLPATMIYERHNRWSDHDHFVSEGGLEPLAYILAGASKPWLSV